MSRIAAIFVSGILFHTVTLAQSFTPDAKASSIVFTISNFGIDVEGTFKEVAGRIQFSETQLDASNFDIQVQANSIATGITLRDKHLKNENYFDVRKYPKITLRSTSVKLITPGEYLLTGNLSIKGKTKVVTIPFHVSRENLVISFDGSLLLDRLDFGIGKNSVTMGDEVKVQLHVVAKPDLL